MTATIPSIEERVLQLLKLIAVEIRPCKLCNTTLYFVEHRNGNRAPYTPDGTNHFLNCQYAEQFRRQKK
jgi:hypothetical protein